MKRLRGVAVPLATLMLVSATGCMAKNAPVTNKNEVHAAVGVEAGLSVEATYVVVGASRARGAARYRLENPRTHVSALELIVADVSGRPYVDSVASGARAGGIVRNGVVVRPERDVAIARDGVVLRALGTRGAGEELAFLKAMLSPSPVRPLRPMISFTSALLSEHQVDEATNGRPASVYKLFGMSRDADVVELYLIVSDDGRSVTFAEKDPENRPLLTRFLSR